MSAPLPAEAEYVVERYGGRGGDRWRAMSRYPADSYDEAREHYARVAANLRHGSVRLCRIGNDEPIAITSAPRLRSRW